jgi:hypothetical protein
LPYNICSLDKTDEEKKELYKIYEKFLSLDINTQFKIFSQGNFLTNVDIEKINDIIFNHHSNQNQN